MKKIKYLIKRIFKMSYKDMFKTINRIHEKTNKSKLVLFFDVVFCGLKHGAGYTDYEYFHFYELSKKQRKTIMTRGRSNQYVAKLNPKEYWHLFDNKNEFNEKFKNYMNRDWMYITGDNFDEFSKFTEKYKTVMFKPNDLSCGKGIKKVTVTKDKSKELYDECVRDNILLIEEVAKQNSIVSKLHPDSVNTVRIVTLISDEGVPYVATAVIRIGTDHHVVDNFNSGGVTAMIDINDGTICSDAINSEGIIFEKHPTTGVKLKGYKIPMWDKIKETVLEAAMVVPEIRLVGWDICVGEDKPIIIEGNQFPCHDLYQPLFGINGNSEGIVPLFEEILSRKK